MKNNILDQQIKISSGYDLLTNRLFLLVLITTNATILCENFFASGELLVIIIFVGGTLTQRYNKSPVEIISNYGLTLHNQLSSLPFHFPYL